MKKIFSVLAIAVLSLGMYSCQPENSVEDTDALYLNTTASDEDIIPNGGGSGGR